MKNLLLIPTLFILFISACSFHQHGKTTQNSNIQLKSDKVLEIAIPPDIPFRSFTTQVTEDNRILLKENRDKNSIDIFDLKKKKYIRSIQFFKSGPNSFQIYSFYYHNKDSIFCSGLYTNIIYLFNNKAQYINKYKIPINLKYSKPNMFRTSNSCPIVYNHNVLSLCVEPAINYAYESDRYHKDYVTVNYAIDKDSTWSPKITHPKSYLGKLYPIQRTMRTYNPHTNQFIYSFAYSHKLFIVNWDSVISEVNVQSKYIDKIPVFKKYDEPHRGKQAYIKIQYADCIYDPFKKVYYRFIFFPGDEKYIKKVNITNEILFRPFAIMLINSDFKILDEIKLPAKTYNLNDFYVDKYGLWISENNPENPNFDENKLKFRLIKLTKNE